MVIAGSRALPAFSLIINLLKHYQYGKVQSNNAISNLTDNNVVLSKVIYKLTSNSHTADNTGCTIVP